MSPGLSTPITTLPSPLTSGSPFGSVPAPSVVLAVGIAPPVFVPLLPPPLLLQAPSSRADTQASAAPAIPSLFAVITSILSM
jgi:hypothetical protein